MDFAAGKIHEEKTVCAASTSVELPTNVSCIDFTAMWTFADIVVFKIFGSDRYFVFAQ
jgi:hypothetical protein